MVRKNLHTSAQIFKEEAKLPIYPIAINDSSWGFLLEWWLIFSDMYFARQSHFETQQTILAQLSEFMEHESSSNPSCIDVQKLQPSVPAREAPFNLDERLIGQFKDTQERWQFANLTNQFNERHDAKLQSPLEKGFEHQALVGSNPLELCPASTIKMPTIELPHSGVCLDADQSQHLGHPFPSVSSTYRIPEGLPPHMSNKQVLQLQQLAENFNIQSFLMPASLGNQLCRINGQNSGLSYQHIGLPIQKGPETVAKIVNDKGLSSTNTNSEHQGFAPQHMTNNYVQQLSPLAGKCNINHLTPASLGNQHCAARGQNSVSSSRAQKLGSTSLCVGLPPLINPETVGKLANDKSISSDYKELEVSDPFMSAKQVQKLPIAGNFHTKDLPMSGSSSNGLAIIKEQNFNGSSYGHIGSQTLKDPEIVAGPDKALKGMVQENQSMDQQPEKGTKKRKQLSSSHGNEENSVSRNISGTFKITFPESKGKSHLANMLKTTDEEANETDGSQKNKSGSGPCNENFHVEDKSWGMEDGNPFNEGVILKEGSLTDKTGPLRSTEYSHGEIVDVDISSGMDECSRGEDDKDKPGMEEQNPLDGVLVETFQLEKTESFPCIKDLNGQNFKDNILGMGEKDTSKWPTNVKEGSWIDKSELLPRNEEMSNDHILEKSSGIPEHDADTVDEDKVN